jgi:hypothetical protein
MPYNKSVHQRRLCCWSHPQVNYRFNGLGDAVCLLKVNVSRTWESFFATLINTILRRNCLLKEVIEGKIKGRIEVTRRRGRRRMQLLGDLEDIRWYCHLKEEALDRTKWRNRFGRGCGPVVWQITDEWMMIKINFKVGPLVWVEWRYSFTYSASHPGCFEPGEPPVLLGRPRSRCGH